MNSELTAHLGKVLRSAIRELRKFAYTRPIGRVQHERPGRRPRLGLALGGGFARGIAHVGVLKVLCENQIPIDALAGTSAGSLVAAAFASGCTIEEMAAAARRLRWNSLARWTFPRLGFATNERMESLLSKTLHCQTFEQLKIPLAIVATDIRTGEAVAFREGGLLMPLRASCSFPGLFVPVEYDGRLLVDGAVVGSVPVAGLSGVDAVVAVHLQSRGFSHRPGNLFEVVAESFHIAQNLNQSVWREHCTLTIEPDVSDIRWDDFQRAEELMAAGEAAARGVLPALRRLLQGAVAGVGGLETASAAGAKSTWTPATPLPTWSARRPTRSESR